MVLLICQMAHVHPLTVAAALNQLSIVAKRPLQLSTLVSECYSWKDVYINRPRDGFPVTGSVALTAKIDVSSCRIPTSQQIKIHLPLSGHGADNDIEKGVGERNELVLSIQGMDCSSCFSCVSRALEPIPTVRFEKPDLMAGCLTLTYDTAFTDGDRILKTILEKSGVACPIVFDGRPGERTLRVRSSRPILERDVINIRGITRVRAEGKDVYSIGFDPAVVRRREAFQYLALWNLTFIPPTEGDDVADSNTLRPILIRTLLSSLLAIPVLIFAWAPLPDHPVLYGGLSLVSTTLIQWGCALYIHAGALRVLLKQRRIGMDLLVTISSTIAYIYSFVDFSLEVAGTHISDGFFETNALLITLILIGRLVLAWTRRRATSSLRALQQL